MDPRDLDFTLGRTITGILSAYLIWYLFSAIRSWHRLRHIPGPLLASFSYLWGYWAMKEGKMNLCLVDLQAKYGKIVRIGPNELLIGDSQSIWQMNNVRSKYGRGDWYANMRTDPYDDHVFSEPDTAKHDKRKAKIVSGYAGKGAIDFEAIVDSQIAILIDLLRSKCLATGGSQAVEFSRLVLYFQVDVITRAGFGKAWGDLASQTDRYEYISTVETFLPWIECINMLPVLRDFFMSRLFLKIAGPKNTDQKGLGKVLGIVKNRVTKRFEKSAEDESVGACMLDEWVKNGLTRRECELELALILPAGTETTSTTIRGIMLYLLSTPKVYRKLQDEIATGIREGLISSPIRNKEAKQLPYLQAVINEGLRMMPPVITGFPKRVPAGGDTICGQFVAEGTDIFLHTTGMMRNKEVFGEDADVFRPERFLDCSAEKKVELMRHIDLIFGHGRWGCPGETLARLELNKVFVEILRRFDAQIKNPQVPWRCQTYVSLTIEDFWISFSEKE